MTHHAIMSKIVIPNFSLNFLSASLVLLIFFHHVVETASSSPSFDNNNHNQFRNKKTILLLDVDNTLYEERYYGIEHQIINNIHKYILNIEQETKEFADLLHHQYGSTIEGLQQTKWKVYNTTTQKLLDKQKLFYNYVYNDVNVRSLLSSPDITNRSINTGYSHQQQLEIDKVRNLLKSLSSKSNMELHIVSNSPMCHIQKVLQGTGLTRIPWTGIWTPDSYVNGKQRNKNKPFPTKKNPTKFLNEELIAKTASHDTKATLIDDSHIVLQSFAQNGLTVR